ncbi:hypothetical protein [Brevundimonas sp.]|uniref:hypothetical protein n=1 Tax=Brevundimonas sp. TaxID=1871086 RepID=UPI002D3884CC|nr:hypothetical protein [Brevundimonas sp.]HYD29215.1 hypothetical protein [Brevundimonas sp.]
MAVTTPTYPLEALRTRLRVDAILGAAQVDPGNRSAATVLAEAALQTAGGLPCRMRVEFLEWLTAAVAGELEDAHRVMRERDEP